MKGGPSWRRQRGMILALAGVLILLAAAWSLGPWKGRSIGDGRHPQSYGFDLNPLLVPRQTLLSSGFAKDGLTALDHPPCLRPAKADLTAGDSPGGYLEQNDRVVGLVLGSQARAYPLRVLNWHGIVNDTLGGEEIAVTYSPLSDSVLVFSRRVAGEVLTFGNSGLLSNSHLLMYDRRPQAKRESLWSQLQMRAVAGPAAQAGRALSPLPAEVITWEVWRARYPQTEVLRPLRKFLGRYRMDPYGSYFNSQRIYFPATPLPAGGDPPYKERVLALSEDGGKSWVAYPFPVLRSFCKKEHSGKLRPDLTVECQLQGPAFQLRRPGRGRPLLTVTSLWFAWYAANYRNNGLFAFE